MTRPALTETFLRLPLPQQFLLAGGAVMLVAMVIVGDWVSGRIERGVVQSAATSAADFVETFVAPLAEDFVEAPPLSDPARRVLAEMFSSDAVRDRIVSYKIWLPDGLIIMASNPAIVGQTLEEGLDLKRAWQGQVAASYEDFSDAEDDDEAALGIPLLEVYSPLHAYFSGDVVAVVEFYQVGSALAEELARTRRNTWLVVGGAFVVSGALLFGIVLAGGRTIERQRELLEAQLQETRRMSAQNETLRRRAVSASARATAQAERALRQLGADLHDGPGQHLALAALRLDALLPKSVQNGDDAVAVRHALRQAMTEIRALSRGRAIPDLDGLDLAQAVERAVQEHRAKTGESVEILGSIPDAGRFGYASKLCVYRFLQESLSNVARHAGAQHTWVRLSRAGDKLIVTVKDDGTGFAADRISGLRQDGGQGLWGLTDRAESLGGSLDIESEPGAGSQITLILPEEEVNS